MQSDNIQDYYKLSVNASYDSMSYVNLQFLASIFNLSLTISVNYDNLKVGVKDSDLILTATCDNPEDYYEICHSIALFEERLAKVTPLKNFWDLNKYNIIITQVRNNVVPNKKLFEPMSEVGFSFNQQNILTLLMGENLYKDKRVCIRELYQNSLDAVRCRKSAVKNYSGRIEFGIETDDKGRFLYCMDNGIGMTKDIIENYFLKVGSSYYKSPDFFRKKASWVDSFSPTSQFGIGFLSCFMIGNRVEVVTKPFDEKEMFICCSIDPNNFFYYKKASTIDKIALSDGGTKVKVYLCPDCDFYSTHVHCTAGELHLAEKQSFRHYFNNLYIYLSTIVNCHPNYIQLSVKEERGNAITIVHDMPFAQKRDFSGLFHNDEGIISFSDNYDVANDDCPWIPYPIEINETGIKYRDIVFLPVLHNGKMPEKSQLLYYFDTVIGSSYTLDGIKIQNSIERTNNLSLLANLGGKIDFIGEPKPIPSVDRSLIVKTPEALDSIAQEVIHGFLKELFAVFKRHNKGYLHSVSDAETIWDELLKKKLKRLGVLPMAYIDNCQLCCLALNAPIFIKSNIKSIRDAESRAYLKFDEYDFYTLSWLEKMYVQYKCITASKIEIMSTKAFCLSLFNTDHIKKVNPAYVDCENIFVSVDTEIFVNYDYLSNMHPFVSKRLYAETQNLGYLIRTIQDQSITNLLIVEGRAIRFADRLQSFLFSSGEQFVIFIAPSLIRSDNEEIKDDLLKQCREKGFTIIAYLCDFYVYPGLFDKDSLLENSPKNKTGGIFEVTPKSWTLN